MPTLIIINGAPSAGKTTVMRRLSSELNIPAMASTDIKEFLFDAVGYDNRDWSRILGRAAVESLYVIAREFLLGGQSVLIESSFWPEYSAPALSSLAHELHVDTLEIYCQIDDATRMQRFSQRQKNREHHPGHVDNLATFRDVTHYGPLDIGENLIFDTTNPSEKQYATLLTQLRTKVQ